MAVFETLLFTLAGIWQGIRQDFNLLEIVLIALLVWRRPALRVPVKLRGTGALPCVLVGLFAIGLRLVLLPVFPEPKPVVSDEFSHLLLADTLLHRRLANPPHPFWQHFESLHIIQQPHYASNYFPGQALTLAVGRLLTGDPWAGVLAMSGIFCAVLCWALQGWLPSRWALFGSLLAVLRFSVGSYWVNGFHGGFLAATGGALLLGALPRIVKKASLAHGAAFALGLGILAMSRPMEGALMSIPFTLYALWRARSRWRVLVPAVVVVGATIVCLGIYNRAVTGSPAVTAYQISQKAYGWPMALAWVQPKPVAHLPIEMERYYRYEIEEHDKVDSPLHFLQYFTFRVQEYWRFLLGPALSVPLFFLPFVWRKARLRIVFAGLAAAFGAIMLEGAASPHYFAPATAVVWLLLIECYRHLYAAPRGRGLAVAIPCILALVLTLRIAAQDLALPYTQDVNYQSWCCKLQGNYNKASLTDYLRKQPGRHLVFVRPKTSEFNLLQWIYNDADIDASRIVWARDLGPEANARLAAYFQGREVWMVDPNVEPARIWRDPHLVTLVR
jgi:hypothetical protein